MPEDKGSPVYRVIRVLEYVGPEEWLDATLRKSIGGANTLLFSPGRNVRELVRTAPEPWLKEDKENG